ncbi:hypothetical protein D3C76_663430 [compost metagenome]|uniref:Uncharacterized protein n=1 Tax=Pseudomonas fluorescens TaxID=294 RepID=A0A5E6XWV3_PSEFL|nr:hypothetical protein PS673_05756 [Pseudomonas fluorescens]
MVVGQHVADRVVIFFDGDLVRLQHACVIDGSNVHHQWQRGARTWGVAVFGGGRNGQGNVAIEVRRRCQLERGQVPTRNVHRRRAVGSIEGMVAIGEYGARRQATQCESERFRTVGVIGVGLDGGQQDRVVFKARVEHLSDIDVVQHAAQAVAVPGAEFEILVAIGNDRNVEAVVLHARGRGVQGANELAAPVHVDKRIIYAGTRCIVERHVIGGAGLRIDSGVEVARITGIALKFDDLAIAAGTVNAGLADFDHTSLVVRVPDAVAKLADIDVGIRTVHRDFLEVG